MSEGRPLAVLRGRDIWLYACAYSFVLLAINYWTGFHVGINDFWGNYYQADNQDFGNVATLYDGFFPIGYPTLLRLAPGDDYIQAGFLIAAAGRMLFVGMFGVIALRYLPALWALTATAAFSIVPRIFENVLTPVADLPLLVLVMMGAGCLLSAATPESGREVRVGRWILAGALFGLAGLIRQHGLVLAAGFMLGALVTRPRDLGYIVLCGLTCAACYSPQIAVNLLAHRGPFETFQYVNIYKMAHGVELRDVPLDLSPDVRAIIAESPATFFVAWARYFLEMLPVLTPAALVAFFVRDVAARRAGAIVLVAGVPYLAAVALGWSARAVLPMIPWAVLFSAYLLQRAHVFVTTRIGRGALMNVVTGAAILLLGFWASERNSGLVHAYLFDHHRYSQVERVVVEQGLVHPKQLYATDGNLYLPLTPPHWPYFDGTWAHYSLYKYAERYPRLDLSSVQAFRRDCVRQGITHVALAGNAPEISRVLGDLLAHPDAHPEFVYLGNVGYYALYRRSGA